jgi:hypothetical protein
MTQLLLCLLESSRDYISLRRTYFGGNTSCTFFILVTEYRKFGCEYTYSDNCVVHSTRAALLKVLLLFLCLCDPATMGWETGYYYRIPRLFFKV